MSEERESVSQNITEILGHEFETDEEGFVKFGDVAMYLLDQTTQAASRYLDGRIEGWPDFSDGLHLKGEVHNYHLLKIHKDDVEKFVQRVDKYRKET